MKQAEAAVEHEARTGQHIPLDADLETGELPDAAATKLRMLIEAGKAQGVGIKWLILAIGGPSVSDRESADQWWQRNGASYLDKWLSRNPTLDWADVIQNAADLQAAQQKETAPA